LVDVKIWGLPTIELNPGSYFKLPDAIGIDFYFSLSQQKNNGQLNRIKGFIIKLTLPAWQSLNKMAIIYSIYLY